MPFEIEEVEMQNVEQPEFWSARDMFQPRSSDVDPNGNLMVAIYSRIRLCDRLQERLNRDPSDEDAREGLAINMERIRNGDVEYVCEDDYFYDVVDNVNMIARYDHAQSPETTSVIGQRIMTWEEFRIMTTRDIRFTTFQEFRNHVLYSFLFGNE